MRLRNGRLASLLAVFAFASFSLYSWPTHKDEESSYQRELQSMQDRLRVLEQQNVRRSHELAAVLADLQRGVNRTNSVPSPDDWAFLGHKGPRVLPGIFHYLPHLQGTAAGLRPGVLVSKGRKDVSIVMGVPTVRRAMQTYLVDTLNSLIHELSAEEKKDCVIVVFVGEIDLDYVHSVVDNLKTGFAREFDSGLLEIISPPSTYYPSLNNLKETFGDTPERVRWRTKQNLDYSFLMLYGQSKGKYFVQLEDDIVARPNYLSVMLNFAEQQPSEDWLILEFSQLGFIGKLFKSTDLSLIVEFFLMFHKDKPIDWLLDHILWVKTCNPEKDAKHCERQKANLRIRFKPSLFQHVGMHSSLSGKIQKLKDRDFGKQPLHKAHPNPPADVSTSLKTYQHHQMDKAYRGDDFFWAFTPVAGDFILIHFHEPTNIARYLFRSGNVEHPGDKLFNCTVEVLPALNDAGKATLRDVREQSTSYKRTDDGFFRVGAFVNGLAEGAIDPSFGQINSVRLSILTDSPVWVLISEIYIKRVAR
uniref:alpha-1,3-mannosyl-glycoprotein 4-beta-N-acetylglucosaminyltransferase B-like isoform X2 n=1 Tax=Myxine glutinosa TaxID=7769 RepID=UPI00358E2ECA